MYIDETTRLLNEWLHDSPLKDVAFKAIMVMPSLLLQKPSKNSKSKDHLISLERRIDLWKTGDLEELLKEGEAIQNNLKTINSNKTIAQISKEFATKMQKGNVNGAIKLLTNHMKNGVLPLTKETLDMLKQKHPSPSPATQEVLLPDLPIMTHPIKFDNIDADMVRKAAIKTNGGSGPSGLDSDGWRRLLTSKSFGMSSLDLCKTLANVIKKICTTSNLTNSLESLLACRLIPLDKNPGLRPIGVGEVLRRIAGKVVVSTLRDDIVSSVGSLQVCAGHDGGCEAAVHAMHQIFDESSTEAVILIDASNAFNSVNREVFLHNIAIVCPAITTYVRNCYSLPSRLFVIGGQELKSSEGTTQGDPIAMAVYAIAIIPLILMIIEAMCKMPEKNSKTVAYADDFSAAGTLKNLRSWWDVLCQLGPKFGYYPEATKSWLIVKPNKNNQAVSIFEGTKINITEEGKRHLGAVIGSKDYKIKYVSDQVHQWLDELKVLCEIAKSEPQAAYSCFVSGYKHKLSYCMRTIPEINELLQPIDELINTEFIPAFTNGKLLNDDERKLFSLPTRFGGMGIPIFSEMSSVEYQHSRKLTKSLCDNIIEQRVNYAPDSEVAKIKQQIKSYKLKVNAETLESLRSRMTPLQLKLNDLNRESGASLWLSSLPLKEEGYVLNKQNFWDLVNIRYGWELTRLPSNCECGAVFNIEHALSCKKGGFISLRHNQLRNTTASMLSEVCKDVCIEPQLQRLSGEWFDGITANKSDEARVDEGAKEVFGSQIKWHFLM